MCHFTWKSRSTLKWQPETGELLTESDVFERVEHKFPHDDCCRRFPKRRTRGSSPQKCAIREKMCHFGWNIDPRLKLKAPSFVLSHFSHVFEVVEFDFVHCEPVRSFLHATSHIFRRNNGIIGQNVQFRKQRVPVGQI